MLSLRHASIIGVTIVLGAALIPTIQSADTKKNPPPPPSGTFTLTGSMNVARSTFKMVLLGNGEVLAVTGDSTGANTAELYNPATRTWTLTGSPVAFHQYGAVTLLPNGEVLLAGGDNTLSGSSTLTFTAAAELYNPSTGKWSVTGNMITPRRLFAAVLLSNGQVLVAGGEDSAFNSLSSAELYNPATGTWQETGSMNKSRITSALVPLGNASILVAGGSGDTSAETYNPSTGKWTSIASMPTAGNVGTLLANGDVLVVRDAFYTPSLGTWTATGPFPNASFTQGPSTVTLLGTGNVLLTGFRDVYNNESSPTTEALLYNFANNAYSGGGAMNDTRFGDAAVLLPNGQVLVAGGGSGSNATSAELYTP